MIKLAFAMTQGGVHRDGHSPDEVASFHLGNGAVHSPHGVIVGARVDDLAALTMGAVFEYPRCWRQNRREYHTLIAERQARHRDRRTHVDMTLAKIHLGAVMARLFAA
jgi:hypothetical protein